MTFNKLKYSKYTIKNQYFYYTDKSNKIRLILTIHKVQNNVVQNTLIQIMGFMQKHIHRKTLAKKEWTTRPSQ